MMHMRRNSVHVLTTRRQRTRSRTRTLHTVPAFSRFLESVHFSRRSFDGDGTRRRRMRFFVPFLIFFFPFLAIRSFVHGSTFIRRHLRFRFFFHLLQRRRLHGRTNRQSF